MLLNRQRVGAIYLALAVAAGLACLRLLWSSYDNLLQMAAGFACGAAAYFLAKAGHRRRVPVFADVETIRRFAERHNVPVAVYLRRFHDDALAMEGSSEEQVALGLGPHALFVAIGRPGEELPTQGAFRLYVSDEHWRGVVRELVSFASLVCLRWAPGGHLGWELEQVTAAGKLDRTAFVLPRLPEGMALQEFLPAEIVQRIDAAGLRERLRTSPALLTLRDDGNASLVRVPEIDADTSAEHDTTALERMTGALAEALALPPLDRARRGALRKLYGRTERISQVIGLVSVVIPSAAVALFAILVLDVFTPFDIIPLGWDLDLILSILGALVFASVVVFFLASLLVSKLSGRS